MLYDYVAKDCSKCPRLVGFRVDNVQKFPDKFNAPVPSFGVDDPDLLIVGLAPGLKGANFTGRPFTGDAAGDILYETLLKFDFASGIYNKDKDDGLTLINCRITNAVRCVPPENKPTGEEIKTCGHFLRDEIESIKSLKVIVSLGLISHNSVLRSFSLPLSKYKFAHGATHALPSGHILLDSYHCSRYNINTNRLTQKMFDEVFDKVKSQLKLV